LQDFFQVLPWRWKAEKVKEYLYSLYYNSPTRPVAERTDWMNSKVRVGLLVIEEKERVIIGEHPFLGADLVTDFSVSYDAARDVELLSEKGAMGLGSMLSSLVKSIDNGTENN
jgi:hypothetical protein